MTIISKNWTYTIEGHDFTLLMAPSEDMLTVKTTISMDGHGPMLVLGFTDDCIITEQQIRITVHGKDVVEDGLSLHNIAVVKKAYTDMLFHLKYDNKQEYKKRYKEEYDAIFSGRKPMQIIKRAVGHSSQKCAIAIGISGDVILDLMAESINSPIEYGGVLLAPAFTNYSLEEMKASFQRKQEYWQRIQEQIFEYQKQKDIDSQDVTSWDTSERYEQGEKGNSKYFKHTMEIHGKTYTFNERNVFDVGKVINPDYPIKEGMKNGGILLAKDGTDYWLFFNEKTGEWFTVREATSEESLAYKLIVKYGGFAKKLNFSHEMDEINKWKSRMERFD